MEGFNCIGVAVSDGTATRTGVGRELANAQIDEGRWRGWCERMERQAGAPLICSLSVGADRRRARLARLGRVPPPSAGAARADGARRQAALLGRAGRLLALGAGRHAVGRRDPVAPGAREVGAGPAGLLARGGGGWGGAPRTQVPNGEVGKGWAGGKTRLPRARRSSLASLRRRRDPCVPARQSSTRTRCTPARRTAACSAASGRSPQRLSRTPRRPRWCRRRWGCSCSSCATRETAAGADVRERGGGGACEQQSKNKQQNTDGIRACVLLTFRPCTTRTRRPSQQR